MIRPEATAAAAQPNVAAMPVTGDNTVRAASSGTSNAARGVNAAVSLAVRKVQPGVGAEASRAGASSAEMVIQARLPAT